MALPSPAGDSMTTPGEERAIARLAERIQFGKEQQEAMIARVANMVIRDRLPPPSLMEFAPQYDDHGGLSLSILRTASGPLVETDLRLHRHALNQLAAKVGLPMTFVNRLLKEGGSDETFWERQLLADNFNELFHRMKFIERGGRPSAFLCRIVGDQLRGFLSRSFNRHLASRPLLLAYVDACSQVGAQPVEAVASDVRLSLKCFKPRVFEPVPGEFIAVGVDWSNSDFGAGKLMVSLIVMRVSSGTAVTLSDEFAKVHLGSVIEDSDVEMSEETAAKEVDTQASAIKDAVTKLLGQEYIDRLLRAIELAQSEEIAWTKLKGKLKDFLYKEELATVETLLSNDMTVDLPPVGLGKDGKPLPTRWWASNIVSMIATKTEDQDRKIELQRQAGKLLEEGMLKEEDPKNNKPTA